MKYFLIAGEASGDLHASSLMKALMEEDPQAEFRFMGGDLMAEVAKGHFMHYRETAYMLGDVFFHLRKIFRNIRLVKDELLIWRPDLVIPVDYPGFNMRIARFAARQGFRVYYYISPKVWVWNRGRIKSLKKYVDRLFTILPFETEFFRKHQIEVEYFGNPLVDQVRDFRNDFEGPGAWKKRHGLDQRPVVALLAGSRIKEIEGSMPAMLKLAAEHPDHQFVVAGAPSMSRDDYTPYLEASELKIVFGETYALMQCARAGLVNSGTATLEAALFELPQVVLYRVSRLFYRFGTLVINLGYISLVNLIRGKETVQEVVRKDLYTEAAPELSRLLEDEAYRAEMIAAYREMNRGLGEPGVSHRVANRMLELTKEEMN